MTGNILLLGASGQVGTALSRRLDRVVAPGRDEFDLGSSGPEDVRELINAASPAVLINCAAYTAVDRAEDETDLADRVNGLAVGALAEIAASRRIQFVTYSTDYVFDGKASRPYVESSPPSPINAYGRSKLLGERLTLDSNPEALIIRTSWVISGTHPNFVATMLRLARDGRSVTVVDDQHGSPTIADDLAEATIEAVGLGVSGVLHLTNQGQTTWFDLARSALTEAALDPGSIEACTTAEHPTRAQRPAYSVLGSERIAGLGVHPLPVWQDSLHHLVSQLMEH